MKQIPLTQGRFAIIDDQDYEEISRRKWYFLKGNRGGSCDGYAARCVVIDGKKTVLLMHRVLLGATTGQEVDHRDRNGLNNTRDNIRIATRSENQSNRKAYSKTGFTGVRKTRYGRFQAATYRGGAIQYLGSFSTASEAAEARAIALAG